MASWKLPSRVYQQYFLAIRRVNGVVSRTFFPGLNAVSSHHKQFSEERVLGYSPGDVFSVVADINSYKKFLPWCLDSKVIKSVSPDKFYGRLVVGFPPLTEAYTSEVTTAGNYYLRSLCQDGKLFKHLLAEWHFDEGPDNPLGQTCNLKFHVKFHFISGLHSALAHMFFNEVVKTMADSFEKRCQYLYGPDFLRSRTKHKNKT